MRKTKQGGTIGGLFFGIVVGAVIGAAVAHYLWVKNPAGAGGTAAPEVERPAADRAPAEKSDDYITRKLREWNLSPDELKSELDKAGRIVREKSRELGGRVAGEAGDVTIIAKIKAKYLLDERLEGLKITVGCKEGHVTLSGMVADSSLIGRAIVLALDTDGVLDVVSSLKVAIKERPGESI